MTRETFIKELDKILKRASAIEELKNLKNKMVNYCDLHGIYDWGLIDLVDERIKELGGDE